MTAAATATDLTRTCQDGFTSTVLISALEAAWATIRGRHPEVPAAVIVVASGSSSAKSAELKWGHFASLRWQHGDTQLPEVLVSGEGLRRTPVEVFTTLLHEATHGLADARDIKDTSRQGRWHNKHFATLASELGLIASKDPKLGWSPCIPQPATLTRYADVLGQLGAAMRAYRHPEQVIDRTRTNNNNGLALECECPRKIRASKTVADEGPIVCGVCDTPFLTEQQREAGEGVAMAFDPTGARHGGMPTYPYRMAPTGLMTRRQLRAENLSPGRQPIAAQILWRRGKRVAYLFRVDLARPRRPATEAHRSELMQAINRGEAFDVETGLPDSMVEQPDDVTWLPFVQSYITMKWPGAAAKSRTSMVDALVTASVVLVKDLPARPDLATIRWALRDHLLPPNRRHLSVPADIEVATRWLERAALSLTDLMEPRTIRLAVDALALKLDGTPVAATTLRRKRAVFYNALQYAVELDRLPFNPMDKLRVHTRRKKVVGTVDRRVVVNPRQARELLTAVSYVGSRGDRGQRLVAFFACLYYAALRPSEALGLRQQNCHLPATGWGRLTLERSRPQAGKRWTDSGEVHDERGLKHRGEDEPRVVPIPVELVKILRAHLDRFGADEDGRLFRSLRGGVVAASSYSRVWEEARRLGLTPEQVSSPLAGRPYDLRHAAVSLWLNSGVPAPEVAERAGHSVDVLLKVYAKCIDGQEATVNARIEEALEGNR